MMTILFYAKLNRFWLEKIEGLRQEFPEWDFVTDGRDIEREIGNAHGLVAGEIPLKVLRDAKNLKIIFVPYAGMDAVRLAFIRERHIRMSNVH